MQTCFSQAKLRTGLLLLSFMFSLAGSAQLYNVKRYGLENGMFGNSANEVYQDSKGYIWVTTIGDKVCRFDGLNFSVYNSPGSYEPFTEDCHGVLHHGHAVFENNAFVLSKNDTIDSGENRPPGMFLLYAGLMDLWGGSWKISTDKVYRYFEGKNYLVGKDIAFPNEIKIYDPGTRFNLVHLIRDNKNNIWLSTKKGLYKFDGKDLKYSGIPNPDVEFVYEDSRSNLWFGQWQGFGVFRSSKNGIKKYGLEDLHITTIYSVLEDGNHNIWLNSAQGSIRFDGERFVVLPGSKGYIIRAGENENRIVLQGPDNGIFLADENKMTRILSSLPIQAHSPCNIISDRENNLWVATEIGLYLLSPSAYLYKPYESYANFNRKKSDIRYLYTDKKKNTYIFNYMRGIYKLKSDAFIPILVDSALYPEAILEDKDGTIWVSTRAEPSNKFYHLYKIKDGKSEVVKSKELEKHSGTKDIGIWPKLILNEKGNVCLLSSRLGVFEFDRKGESHLYPLPEEENKDSQKQQVNVVENIAGSKIVYAYYCNNRCALYVFDEGDKSFHKLLNKADSIPPVNKFYCSSNGNYWFFGAQDAIYLIKNKKIVRFKFTEKLKKNLFFNPILVTGSNQLWYQTEEDNASGWVTGDGLNAIQLRGDSISQVKLYDQKNGLSSRVNGFTFDSDSNVWFVTPVGIGKINRSKGPDTFSQNTIPEDPEYNEISRSNDSLLAYSQHGVVILNSRAELKNKVPPLVNILKAGYEYFVAGDNHNALSVTWTDLPQNLFLTFDKNTVFFDVRALSFREHDKIMYKYFLEGFDKGWGEPCSQTFVKYTNLPEGNYTFKVFASNNSGLWNLVPTTFSFRILPPWYRTWWAYSGYFILLISAIWSLVSWRTKALLTRQKQLEKTVQERTSEVMKQKHEIESKNQEITDSINYATRIQNSVLPPLENISRALLNSFVLFRPKDIVSGDFYWFQENSNGYFIAVADCTGHGVPGAIMSVICSEKLTEAFHTSSDSGTLLNLTNKGLKKTLRQTDQDGSTRDGMDIALCFFDKEMKYLEYSGANRPLWIIRKSSRELIEFKATKTALGGHTQDNQEFAKNRIELFEGDTIYLSSDGFADQFGPTDKKLMTRVFKEYLISIQDKTMPEQRTLLNDYHNKWKGNMEQTDDVLVIGIRIG